MDVWKDECRDVGRREVDMWKDECRDVGRGGGVQGVIELDRKVCHGKERGQQLEY